MSIFTCQGGGRIGAPIQIVLSVYENALELLSDFDLAAGGNSVTNKHLNEKRVDPKKLFFPPRTAVPSPSSTGRRPVFFFAAPAKKTDTFARC